MGLRYWRLLRLWQRVVLLLLTIGVILVGLVVCFSGPTCINHSLFQTLSKAKQVYVVAETADNDHASTGIGRGVFPADVGIKSNLEYIRYLVRNRVFSEKDLHIFCKRDRNKRSLDELKSEDIAFRFANVSSKDSLETIFLVGETCARKTQFEWWLEYLMTWKKPTDYQNAYVVLRLNGTGNFFTKPLLDLSSLTPLPPREPKFLDP